MMDVILLIGGVTYTLYSQYYQYVVLRYCTIAILMCDNKDFITIHGFTNMCFTNKVLPMYWLTGIVWQDLF